MSSNLLIKLDKILKRYNQGDLAQVFCLQGFETTKCLDDNILLRRQLISYCTWDSNIDIKKASLLLTAYPEKKWLGLLKTFNLSSSKNKLKSKIYELEDTIEMFVDSRNSDYSLPLHPKSISEIHNDLVKESRRQKNLELNNRVLPQKLSDLDNIKAGEMKIVTPKIGEDLIVWGKELNNCLMSYIERVIHTKYSVIGILKENKIKYALGIFDREIQQFSGINNSSPLAQDEKMIRKTLLKYNIL